MKKFYLFLLSIFLLNVFSVNAQSTDGTDFWLTFGKNWREGTSTANPPGENNTIVVPRIRIVSKDLVTEVQIVFTNLSATSPDRVISRTLQPRSAETIALNTNQKNAAYLTSSGTSSLSIHITSDHPITAYALNQCNKSADATNILPVPALGTDYYQISYQPQGNWATPMYGAPSCQDAYAVIATEDNTRVFHANGTTPVATLNTGQVYYRTSGSDMTGTHVTADKPVAFFALNQGTWIKNSSSKDCLFQQLAPVDTWGYNFLIPVTNISGNNHIDRVRIVASQDSTHVTRHGGSHVSAPGGQTGLTPYTLNAGQFIELEVFYNQDGCFIEADKPVGVCPYLITPPSTSDYDPAQAWLPSMEQLATAALIAPFKPTSGTSLTTHMALILAPTDAAPNTRVTIGTGLPTTLPSNGWRANAASGMSFYNYDMTDLDASYRFTNTDGIIVMAYGYGPAESYYYLGYSSMLNLNAYFEANNVHNGLIENMLFCDEYEIEFIATLENVFNLKWYINDPLKLQPLHENEDIWEQTFSAGNYSIVMYVEFIDGTTNEFEGILHIGANITATADPGIGGTVVPPTECVQVGETVTLTAIPNTPDYVFDGWTQGNTPVLGGETLTFTVTGDRDLTAHFKLNNVDITTSVAPSNVGTTEGDDSYQVGSIATVKATADSCHTFLNWTDDKGRELSTDNPYSFTVTGQLHLIAHFTLNSYTVTLYADPSVGSSLSGDGEYNCGDYVTVTATESDCYTFENWTDNKGEVVSDENPYTFNIENTCDLTANFTLNTYKVASSSHPEEGGTTLGDNTDFPCGDYIILTATPDPCYNFVNWTEDGKQVSTDNPYNFKVTEPHNVVANFEIKLYNVFLLANPSTSNEVDGYGYNFDCGDPININASPGDCYTFSNWTNSAGEVVSTDPNFTFTILSDTTLTANFTLNDYPVSLSVNNSLGGSTSSEDDHFPCGEEITVTALPDPCYNFVNWTEDGEEVSDQLSYTFEVTEPHSLVANFEIKLFDVSLTANPPTGNTVSNNITNSDNITDIDCGASITVVATPDDCYDFVNWTENGIVVHSTPSYTFDVTDHTALVANFQVKIYNVDLWLYPNPPLGGSVTGDGNVPCESNANAFAEPDDCYNFVNWTENGVEVCSTPSFNFLVTGNRTYYANFEIKKFNLSLSSNPSAGGSVTGDGNNINCGTAVTATATPNSCYTFTNWTEGGVWVSDDPAYGFDLTESHSLVANFAIKHFDLAVSSANPPECGTVSSSETDLPCGTYKTVTATPDPCYNFVNWTENGVEVSKNATYGITINEDHDVVAHFEIKKYNVSVSQNIQLGNTATGEVKDIDCGETVTVTAIPDICYDFINWTENGISVSSDAVYDFTLNAHRNLVANFQIITYPVSLTPYPPTYGTTVGSDTAVDCGDKRTITATPFLFYHFLYWEENGVPFSYNATEQIDVTQPRTLTAIFEPKNYDVLVSADPAEGGTATGGGIGLPYESETTVVATPKTRWVFTNWTENDNIITGAGATFEFPVTRDFDLVAHFEPETYTIIVKADPEEGGIALGTGYHIELGTIWEIKARPFENYDFINWTTEDGVFVSFDTAYTFIVEESMVLIAHFQLKTHKITVLPAPPEGGTVLAMVIMGTDTVTGMSVYCVDGDSVTVMASANNIYEFDYWEENDETVSLDSIYTFTVTRSCDLVAHFKLKKFYVIVLPDPGTGGTVSGGGFNFSYGDSVTVIAEPNSEWEFLYWTEDDTVKVCFDPEYTFNIVRSRTLTAHFQYKTFDIILYSNPGGGGTVWDNGYHIPYGTMDTVHASANPNYVFVNWTEDGAGVSNDEDYLFSVVRSRTLYANFEYKTFDITVLADPSYGGTVWGGGTNIPYGTDTAVYASANPHFTFLYWTYEDGTFATMDTDFYFTVVQSLTLTAHFEAESYTVTLSSDPPQGGSVSGGGDYDYGTEITVTATPDDCYTFEGWYEDGGLVWGLPDYTFTVEGDRDLVAHFEQKILSITTSANQPSPNGGSTTGDDPAVPCGEYRIVTAIPDLGYAFVDWTINGTPVSNSAVYNFKVEESCELVANFIYVTHLITLEADPWWAGTVWEGGAFPNGTELTVHAAPNTEYQFLYWSEDGNWVSGDADYEFMVDKPRHLVAHFDYKTLTVTTEPDPYIGGYTYGDATDIVYETVHTVEAEAKDHFTFNRWTIDGITVSYSAVYDFPVTESCHLVAHFDLESCNVVLIPAPTPGGIPTGGGPNIPFGATITVHANPNDNYEFVNWTEDGDQKSVNPDYEFTVTHSCTLTANYRLKSFDIILSSNPGNGGTVWETPGYNIAYGTIFTAHAQAAPNYKFLYWLEDDYPDFISYDADYEFAVTRSRNLIAHFTLQTFDITVEAAPTYGGQAWESGSDIPFGTVYTVHAQANQFFSFDKWTEDGVTVGNDPDLDYPVSHSCTLVAHFKADIFTVTLTADPVGGGTLTGAGDYEYLSPITVTATPDECYTFAGWYENGFLVYPDPVYPFIVEGDRELEARFEQKLFMITTEADPVHGGTVVPDTAYILCGEELTVVATPNTGYIFTGWTENDLPVPGNPGASYTFNAMNDRNLVANFIFAEYTITLLKDPYPGGDVFGGGVYPHDSLITVRAVAHPGYEFVEWTEDDITVPGAGANYTFNVTGSRTLTAHFDTASFHITTAPNDYSAGITFPADTAVVYGEYITVTAEPYDHFLFVNWTEEGYGEVSDTAVFTFPVNRSRDLVANFIPETYFIELTPDPTAGGTVEGGGAYDYGEVDTVLAKPNLNYTFIGWFDEDDLDNPVETDPMYHFTVDRSRHLIAKFKPKAYVITVEAILSGGGQVSGAGAFYYGEMDTVRATVNPNYIFNGWTENGYPVYPDTAYSFPVTCSRHLVANFSLQTYHVYLSAEPGGTVSGGGNSIPYGETTTITAEPATNYDFAGWYEDDLLIFAVPPFQPYPFAVDRNYDLVAHFTPKNYVIELEVNPPGTGKVFGDGTYPYLEMITVEAEANPNYEFVNWTEDTLSYAQNPLMFPVTRSRHLIANFAPAALNVLLSATEGGTVEGEAYNIPYGTSHTVYAFPDTLYHFENWTENDVIVSNDAEYEFFVEKTRYLVANFLPVTTHITLLANPPDGGTFAGGGDLPQGKLTTVTAIPNGCYNFVNWTEKGEELTDQPDFTFMITDTSRTLVANFVLKNVNITTAAEPEEGGIVIGEYLDTPCGKTVTVIAFANNEYTFAGWSLNGEIVSTDEEYSFEAAGDAHLIAIFDINTYEITLVADPPELGAVLGDGNFPYGEEITVHAYAKPGYSLANWTENGAPVSTDPDYTFTVTRARTLVAHFDVTKYTVNVQPNDSLYGTATGGGVFSLNDTVFAVATAKNGYRFLNWTIEGADTVVSKSPTYIFLVTESVDLVANFYGLDFDTYAATLWDNTFLLNLNLLADEGYEITGCKWFKNGKQEMETNTIDEYSYSAGPKITDLLELAPTYYTFRITIKNGSELFSTKKVLTNYKFTLTAPPMPLRVYPNPVRSGVPFTMENLTPDTPIFIYNQFGVCVSSSRARGDTDTHTLQLPAGVYFIRNQNKETKITVIR